MLKKPDIYTYDITFPIRLGHREWIHYEPRPPQSFVRVERVKFRVDGSGSIPCPRFLFISEIILNGVQVTWLSINRQPESKFCPLLGKEGHDLHTIQEWAETARIWPSIRVYPSMAGRNLIGMYYTGLIPEGGKENEFVNVSIQFSGPSARL